MSQNEKSISDDKKQRRSPSFPLIPIDEAIDKARQIYTQDKRAFTDFKTLAGHLGYKVENKGGRAGRTISALKQYGLLEERGGQYRISDTAWKILEMPEDTPERGDLVKEAALRPPMIRKILSHYSGELPSEQTLRSHLLFNEGFNADSTKDFIRVLRRTIELVNLAPEDYTAGEESEEADYPLLGGRPVTQPQAPKAGPGPSGAPPSPIRRSFLSGMATSQATQTQEPQWQGAFAAPLAPGEKELKVNISENTQARIIFNGQVTQEAIELLSDLLGIQKRTFPKEADLARRSAVWHNKDYDQPVTVTGEAGEHEGRRYVKIEGSETAVPEDELEYT